MKLQVSVEINIVRKRYHCQRLKLIRYIRTMSNLSRTDKFKKMIIYFSKFLNRIIIEYDGCRYK